MSGLYWFALIVGVGMYAFSLAADLFGGADGVDADHDVAVGHDADGAHDHADDGVHGFKILSVRNATYFLFAFGVTGVALSWLWGGERGLLTALFSTLLGVAGGAISSFAFGWVKRTESGWMPDDRGWVGLLGRVTLALSQESTGKILVTRGGREHELLARPFENEATDPQQWTRVMVLEMQDGVAMVTPSDPALENPAVQRIAPTSES